MEEIADIRDACSKKKTESKEVVKYSDEYAFIIGKVGLSPAYFFSLTPAETSAIVDGYIYNRDISAANFRALFWLQFNQYSKHPKKQTELWPLSIDGETSSTMTADDMYARNKKVIEQLSK